MDTRFVNSSTFRLALIYMLLFGGSVLVLLGFIYWSTISYMSSQTDNTIEIDILASLQVIDRQPQLLGRLVAFHINREMPSQAS